MDEITGGAGLKSLRVTLATEVIGLLQEVPPNSSLHINAIDNRGQPVKLLCIRDSSGHITLDIDSDTRDVLEVSDGSLSCSVSSVIHPVYLVMNEPSTSTSSSLIGSHQVALISTKPLSTLSSDGIIVKLDDMDCDEHLALSSVVVSSSDQYIDVTYVGGNLDVAGMNCDVLYNTDCADGATSHLLLDNVESASHVSDLHEQIINCCSEQSETNLSVDQDGVRSSCMQENVTEICPMQQLEPDSFVGQDVTCITEESGSGAICGEDQVCHFSENLDDCSASGDVQSFHQINADGSMESITGDMRDIIEETTSSDSTSLVDSIGAFNRQSEIQTLVDVVENITVYSCYFCQQYFPKLQILKGHIKRQHSVECEQRCVKQLLLPVATVCRQCGYIGMTEHATRLHIVRKHHIAMPRQERLCKTDPRRLMWNRRRMAAQKAVFPRISCLICATEIGLLKNYDGHVKRHHLNDPRFHEAIADIRRIQFERTPLSNLSPVTCSSCNESFDPARLIAHVRWIHKDADNINELVQAARGLIRGEKQRKTLERQGEETSCPHCGRSLRQISLANHVKFYCSGTQTTLDGATSVLTTPSSKSFVKCDLCGKRVLRPKLSRHRRLAHKIGVYKPVQMFTCTYCPREFAEPHQLRTHIKKHTGESLVVCLLCYRCFTDEYVFQVHLQHVHCAEFRHNCVNCGRGFWKESTVAHHTCVPASRDLNIQHRNERMEKMAQLQLLNKPLFTVVNPDDPLPDEADGENYVWLCLLCKKSFCNRVSYDVHYNAVHLSCFRHTCVPCGRQFMHAHQMRTHKCRPENHANNVQKEMVRRGRARNVAPDYVGPTCIAVRRHEDIANIISDDICLIEEYLSDSDDGQCDNGIQLDVLNDRQLQSALNTTDSIVMQSDSVLSNDDSLHLTDFRDSDEKEDTLICDDMSAMKASVHFNNLDDGTLRSCVNEHNQLPTGDRVIAECHNESNIRQQVVTGSGQQHTSHYRTRKRNISFLALANGSEQK